MAIIVLAFVLGVICGFVLGFDPWRRNRKPMR
jgi:hypothetical protein